MADLNVALILRLIDQATGPARAAIQNVQAAGLQVQRFGEAQIAAGRTMQETAAAHTAALHGQTVAAAAMGFALYGLMRPAVQFESAMARVGAVSGATAEEQALLSRTARELGASTVFSASEAAQGMQFLAMAGFDVNQTIAAMPGLLDLAAAAGSDLGRTSDIASNILSGFGFQAGEMGRVGDVLVNTFTTSNTTLEMLGATMSYVAPQAAAARMELETVAAMAGILGNNGIQGERGGTALRAMLTRLASPSDEAAAALERLNVQISDEGGNLRDLPTILAEMDQSMEGMGTAVRQELLTAIFGMEASTAALVLAQAAGRGELQRYAESLRETGSAARVAAQMNATARGALEELAGAVEEAQIALGNGLLPVLNAIVQQVLPLVVAAGKWIVVNQELVTTIGFIAAGLIGLNVATLAARWGFWLLFGWVGRLRVAFGAAVMAAGILTQVLSVGLAWGMWAVIRAGVLLIAALRGIRTAALALTFASLIAGSGKAAAAVAAVGLAFRALTRLPRFALSSLLIPVAWGAGLIGRIPWAALAGALSWGTLIRPLSWLALRAIPVIGWALLAGQLAWHLLIVPLGWDEFIPQIDWSRWFNFEWAAVLPRWNWASIIPSISGYFVSLGASMSPFGSAAAPSPGAARMAAGSATYPRAGINPVPRAGGRAIGGPVRPGFGYDFHEEGLELFVPDVPGRTIRHQDVARLMARPAAQAAPQLTIGDIHVHAAPGMDARAVAAEVRRQIEEAMRTARFALNDGGVYG